MSMLKKTTAQRKILQLKRRIRIVQGGTSASKTFSIIPVLIGYAQSNKDLEISIVSESIPHLKRGAMKDFIKILKWTDNWDERNFNRTDRKYTFPTGSYIEFFSADQDDKLRGARRDILFINECNNVTFDVYLQLSIRTRMFVYLDYNPSMEFWVHEHLLGDEDVDFLILTYKDNEALEESLIKEIEKAKEKAKTSKYWLNWWRVYGLGQVGVVEGIVFDNWSLLDKIPEDAELIGHGLDFGFSNDPTAMVSVYRYKEDLILDERIYERGLTNFDIANRLKELGVDKREYITADSAEPKSISEINSYGYRLKPVVKGRDSKNYGISLMLERGFKVTSNSVNLIKELRNYMWDRDKAGNALNVAVGNDDAIDSARYLFMMRLGGAVVNKAKTRASAIR